MIIKFLHKCYFIGYLRKKHFIFPNFKINEFFFLLENYYFDQNYYKNNG